MIEAVINKANLNNLIDAITKDGRFYGPVDTGDGVSLRQLGPDDQLAFDYFNIKLPPKREFFPYCEVMGTYEDKVLRGDLPSEEKVVIFGVRPCDARSFLFLDKVFLDEQFVDPYYRKRRDNILIMAMSCNQPEETCFCTSVDGSPSDEQGSDIMAFDLGESLLLKAATEKGEVFMEAHSSIFAKPTAQQISTRDEQASAAREKLRGIDVSQVAEKLPGNFNSPVWDEIGAKCVGCGTCTYLCPTCHCFGLHDQRDLSAGRRIRVQDSCMYPGFALEASGHNPRNTRGERIRQRIMHKFSYTVENFGDTFCVGCGRCISNCPVNLDIRETVIEAAK